ncbi:MAG: hypothetical protein IKX65_10525 [Prevotella sp.]|nr:hypothetical protein [Prevotella sp.]
MKRVLLLFGVLLSLGMFCACSSDDENGFGSDGTIFLPKDSLVEESLKSVPELDYTGYLSYEGWLKTWAISYHHPGSIDWVDVYFPVNLPDELKTNNEERVLITFSGKVVEMTDEDIKANHIILLGGHKYYFVYLTKIRIIEKVE